MTKALYLCFGLAAANLILANLRNRSFLADTPFISSQGDLERFERLVRRNMHAALAQIGLLVAAALGSGTVRVGIAWEGLVEPIEYDSGRPWRACREGVRPDVGRLPGVAPPGLETPPGLPPGEAGRGEKGRGGRMRMRFHLLAALTVLGSVSCSADGAAVSEEGSPDSLVAAAPPSALVIGTFDSRCVALAYYRSEESLAELDTMMAEYEKAVAAGDSTAARELDALGRDRQDRMHAQVFSAADADEVIWEIWDVLPEVAAEAGVDVIVSEWDVIWADSLFRPVDVTDFLVRRFHPDEETMDIVMQMKGMPAVPPQLLSPDV